MCPLSTILSKSCLKKMVITCSLLYYLLTVFTCILLLRIITGLGYVGQFKYDGVLPRRRGFPVGTQERNHVIAIIVKISISIDR